MKNKKILFLIAFISGIVFCVASFFVFTQSRSFVRKVARKLEERRIANIPKAKEPLILSDFEDPGDLEKWNSNNASIELSSEHATSGNYSTKITFMPATGASAVKIEKYFEKNKSIANWSGYEVLTFDIFNPNPKSERMILQIRDTKGRKTKINLQLAPKVNNIMVIDIARLWGNLKPSGISQLNLFLWGNKNNKVFYLDNVKLLPEAALEKKNKNILDTEFIPKAGEKIYATGDYLAFNRSKWLKADAVEIPLIINNYLSLNMSNLYFSGGVPFGLGELKTLSNLELADDQGNIIPFQAKILSRWTDKTIKWVFLNFKSEVAAGKQRQYYLKYADSIQKQETDSGLYLKETPEEITVNTGKIQFSLNKKSFYLFDNVWLDKNSDGKFDENEIVSSKNELALVHNGKEYYSHLDKNYKITIEERGPLKACLKAQGWFVSAKGERFCQFIVRIYAFEGCSYLKVQHTFIYTGYPENKFHYFYKGRRLPKNDTIDEIYLKTPIKIGDGNKFTFSADNKVMQADLSDTVEFLQDKFNTYGLSKGGQVINSGNKLDGWIDLSNNETGIALGIKNFWQQFPKGILIDKQNQYILTYLWPKQAGKLDFKTTQAAMGPDDVARGSAFGIGKTHEIFFYFHQGDYKASNAKEVASGLGSDILISANPLWISDTKVLGRILPYEARLGSAEDFLSHLFDWGDRQIKSFNWYGMADFGDTLSWYRKEAFDKSYEEWGWHPEGRHGWFNCEAVGTHTGALIQFLRTGDYKYFNFGANLARHIMDIDTCHYNTIANDKRLKGQIPDDYSQVGSMHRHSGNHWSGRNEESSHTNVLGLVIYYYLTGDMRARDVIDEVGSFFLSEKIAYFRHPDIAPQRSIANVLWGDLVLYELTGDEKYKQAADKWANLFYQGQKYDGAWAENYNPVKKRWEGKPHMMFIEGYTLPALIAYHQITGNKAIAECITKVTDFVIRTEEYAAYFDASAYSYWLTGDKKYLGNVKNRLDYTIKHQNKSNDSLWDGMIYQKAYYERVAEYLYKLPFALEVLVNE